MGQNSTEIDQKLVKYIYDNFKHVPKGIEYEKMVLNVPYNCFEKTLLDARTLSHELVDEYGDIKVRDFGSLEEYHKKRVEHLQLVFGKCTDNVFIEYPFYVDYGCNIELGDRFYANYGVTFLDCSLIKFGDNVMVGPHTVFTCATHPANPITRLAGVEFARPIIVGNNVWFGANCTILPGVTIGDGAVIGAGTVVTKDVPANSLCVGVPGRITKTGIDKLDI
ncbi:uncharacterized protein KQ657_000271 [Scheffersomyces spartinae]|uniref:Acetyltransferase n=1 Tax=Scheffersomyces spartinae TaxID=45513 RepID=A0A9P7VFE0_9ASCO|nr:uncharacterized protein KQ657_000271 [Scheffersomyces spartinae]KAG7196256.1 hypothetical protein KQ657_000271 [Scheffersomyces spartinae]